MSFIFEPISKESEQQLMQQYAQKYLEGGYMHETADEFTEQVAMDWGRPEYKKKVLSQIRRMSGSSPAADGFPFMPNGSK